MLENEIYLYPGSTLTQVGVGPEEVSFANSPPVLTIPNVHLNGRVPNSDRTANLNAGLKSLENLGMKMTNQSLGVRLMSELKREGVGTAEIEAMAQKRVQQRNDKNGIKEGKQNGFIPQGIQRDVSLI